MLRSVCSALLILLLASDCIAQPGAEPDFVPLFNGRDLSGWRIVNTDTSTWQVRDDMIVTTGKPIGELCTTRQYENFVLEIEWRHMVEGGNAGLFVHSDPITAVGRPFTRAIEVQIMDGNHGDVFAIHGATMVPDRPHPQGWMRSLPVEERAHPTGAWNHYRVESRDGTLTLAVNGKKVSGGSEISPRKGYICLESEGSEAHFRNIRIRELPSTNPAPEETADVYDGFTTLYTGVDLSGWKGGDPWVADDWVLRNAGTSNGGEHLWTGKAYGNFELIADFRVECQEAPERRRSGILLRRGTDAELPIGCSAALAGVDSPGVDESGANSRGWQRLRIRMVDNRAAVEVVGRRFVRLQLPPGSPEGGAIGLGDYGAPVEYANLFLKELNP